MNRTILKMFTGVALIVALSGCQQDVPSEDGVALQVLHRQEGREITESFASYLRNNGTTVTINRAVERWDQTDARFTVTVDIAETREVILPPSLTEHSVHEIEWTVPSDNTGDIIIRENPNGRYSIVLSGTSNTASKDFAFTMHRNAVRTGDIRETITGTLTVESTGTVGGVSNSFRAMFENAVFSRLPASDTIARTQPFPSWSSSPAANEKAIYTITSALSAEINMLTSLQDLSGETRYSVEWYIDNTPSEIRVNTVSATTRQTFSITTEETTRRTANLTFRITDNFRTDTGGNLILNGNMVINLDTVAQLPTYRIPRALDEQFRQLITVNNPSSNIASFSDSPATVTTVFAHTPISAVGQTDARYTITVLKSESETSLSLPNVTIGTKPLTVSWSEVDPSNPSEKITATDDDDNGDDEVKTILEENSLTISSEESEIVRMFTFEYTMPDTHGKISGTLVVNIR